MISIRNDAFMENIIISYHFLCKYDIYYADCEDVWQEL